MFVISSIRTAFSSCPILVPNQDLQFVNVLGTALKQVAWFCMTYRIIKITKETNYTFTLLAHS